MDEHIKVFEKDLGTWDAEIEVRPQPGTEVQRSRGVTVNRLVGGRWLVGDYKNETTGFEGHGVYGWDAAKQRYVGTWVDSMRSAMILTEGTWDAATRTMTFVGEMQHGGQTLRWRDITQTVEPGHQLFRTLMADGQGGEWEMMKVDSRRR